MARVVVGGFIGGRVEDGKETAFRVRIEVNGVGVVDGVTCSTTQRVIGVTIRWRPKRRRSRLPLVGTGGL